MADYTTGSPYNTRQDALVRACNIQLKIGTNSSDAKVVGLVDNVTVSKSIQVDRAQCIGSLFCTSIDPKSITVQITCSGFVPTKQAYAAGIFDLNGGGEKHLGQYDPSIGTLMTTERFEKIDYIELYDAMHDQIITGCHWCIVSSVRKTIQATSYVKADLTIECIDETGYADLNPGAGING